MTKKILFILTIILFNIQFLFALTGREIMQKSDNLPVSKTVTSKAEMTIYKGGDRLKKIILIKGMKIRENEKNLIKIKEIPGGDITKVLTHTEKGSEDLQWLKMANGRIKRIASGDRSGAFVNSHIFYEDLRSRDINDYKYNLLGNETVESFDCYKVEAIPEPGKSIYNKAVFYVIKSGNFAFFIARIDIFYKGYQYKRMINYNIKKISGIITPLKSIMYRLNKKGEKLGRTVLEIQKIKYNSHKIKSSIFNKSRL